MARLHTVRQPMPPPPALLLLALGLQLLLSGVGAAAAAPAELLPAAAYMNAADLPLLMPANQSTDGRGWYYELPRDPVGVLVMLHRCGRNAEDFWPPSAVCPQCIGMPEGVSISKQALARGYALLAINSADREVGPGTRCWSWGTDAMAVRDIVKAFRREHKLTRLPLIFTGCSSGGSLALRLPNIMHIDGIMPVAIALEIAAFPLADPELEHPYPPVAFVHFTKDNNTDRKVAGMLEVMKAKGVPAAEARVPEFAVTPDFFSRRDDMISEAVSQQLHDAFLQAGILNESHYIHDGWSREGLPPPWDPILLDNLAPWLAADRAEQLALKKGTTLALAQQALLASGEVVLPQGIQRDDWLVAAAADAAANAQDVNSTFDPNFSDSDGQSSASGGQEPYLSAKLMSQRIKEEIAVAWASHTNLGDYTTAALIWLERCGRANFNNLAAQHHTNHPATLSPVRTPASAQIASTWRACQPAKTSGSDPAVAAESVDRAPEDAADAGSLVDMTTDGTSGSAARASAGLGVALVLAAAAAAMAGL